MLRWFRAWRSLGSPRGRASHQHARAHREYHERVRIRERERHERLFAGRSRSPELGRFSGAAAPAGLHSRAAIRSDDDRGNSGRMRRRPSRKTAVSAAEATTPTAPTTSSEPPPAVTAARASRPRRWLRPRILRRSRVPRCLPRRATTPPPARSSRSPPAPHPTTHPTRISTRISVSPARALPGAAPRFAA